MKIFQLNQQLNKSIPISIIPVSHITQMHWIGCKHRRMLFNTFYSGKKSHRLESAESIKFFFDSGFDFYLWGNKQNREKITNLDKIIKLVKGK